MVLQLFRFVWDDGPAEVLSPAAIGTEKADPLPSPPQHLVNNPEIKAALKAHQSRIKVDTPFKIDKFEALLSKHPNQPFVKSVIKGLREGFWPFDEGEWKIEKEKVFRNNSMKERNEQAVKDFRDAELSAGRWSAPFTKIMPGMKTSPMLVRWQDEKPRVISDHTRSGLNSGIRNAGHVIQDDMRSFGQCLQNAKRRHPSRLLVTFKDDVAKAFLNLPVHPIWQLRQVVVVEGKYYIVRRLAFGSRAAPKLWCAVSNLICWIAVKRRNITGLHVYMDDFFGWDFADHFVFHNGARRPQRQALLLKLWDEIGCPYEDRKQLYGCPLEIIGYEVNINQGTLSLSPASIKEAVDEIRSFLSTTGGKPSLREWQRLAGLINWTLNVLPWGRPALTGLHRETSRKLSTQKINITADVKRDLIWLLDTLPIAIGVSFDNGTWRDDEADLVISTDASLKHGLAFVLDKAAFYYQLRQDSLGSDIDIFFLELVAILSAVWHTRTLKPPPRRLLIWTDNMGAVKAFSSLRAPDALHNGPLFAVATVITQYGIDLRVKHVAGKKNTAADLLSRLRLDEFKHQFPGHRVEKFEPPRKRLPPQWSKSF